MNVMTRWGLCGLALLLVGCSDDPPAELTDACADQAPGTACTWLGLKGDEGYSGEGQPRWATRVNQVQDLLFLPDGTAWFTDFNNYLIRKVLPDGTVHSVVGSTDPIFPGEGVKGGAPPDGAPGAEWALNHPTNLLLSPDGLSVVLVA